MKRVVGLIATLALLTAACGGGTGTAPAAATEAPKPAFSAAQQTVIDAAKKEGELQLVWPGGVHDGPEQLPPQIEAFKKYYGLDAAFKVQFTPGPQMPDMAAKLIQELQANRPASTDVFLGTQTHVTQLMKAKALETPDWAAIGTFIKPELVAPDNIAVQIQTRIPGITYNTNKLKGDQIPTSMADLLKPIYKGRIAVTPYGANFGDISSPQIWGKDRLLDYVKQYVGQTAGLIQCGEVNRIASGEFDILAMDCGEFEVKKLQATGAPVGWVIPKDAGIITYFYTAVPKHAAHPNAAKLWINFSLSRAAQDLLYKSEFADHHKIAGSKSADSIKKQLDSGTKFTEVNVEFVLLDEKNGVPVAATRTEMQRILQKR